MFLAHFGQAGLVNQWTGDGYSSGNWVDSVGGVTATASGTPQAVANAFGTHTGVAMNGGYFLIPAGTAPAGVSNFTIVVVIKPTNVGPFNANYFNAIPLAAFDISGSGQADWGLSYGGIVGQNVVDGVGVQTLAGAANGDVQQSTPSLALNTVHAVALQVRNDPVLGTNVILYADGVAVQTNTTLNVTPRSATSSVYVGGGTFVTARFPGQIAALQFYNDGATNCATLTQNLLSTYATPAPITLPYSSGADVGQGAPVTIGIPASASANGSFTVTLTSDNPSVVASTSVTFSQNQITKAITLPVLALGTANITATGSGVGSATMVVAGLDESGLANEWLADNYVNNSTSWVDNVGNVTATGSGAEIAVPNAFGTGHQGVSRNATGLTTGTSGFIIPGGTAPGGLQSYTLAVVFKPTSIGPVTGNYYSGQIIFGYDIGGAGQADFGMSWCGANPATGQVAGGQRIVVGIGRSGGDSQLSSGQLTLNATHCAVLQVDAVAHTQTLFVDGAVDGQNTALTMNTVSSQAIPFLNQSSANIANAFPGLVAEARVYNSATVNAAALSGALLAKYAGLPPITLASAQPYADVGSNVTVTVTVPASASLAAAFPVTLTSDTPGVVASSSVTVAKGATTTNVNLTVLGVGVATLTASGSGVGAGTLKVGGLAPRQLSEVLRASSLATQNPGIADGNPLGIWYGDSNATTTVFVYIGVSNNPTFHASATPNGKPAAVFNYGPMLLDTNTGAVSPLAGFTNFSIAMVFKSAAPGLGAPGVAWFNGVGILDGDEVGAHPDWGLALDGSGNFIFGVGNPDASLPQTNYNLVSPLFHAIVCAWDGMNQQMRLYVDDKPATVLSGSSVPTGARDNASVMLGGTAAPPNTRTDPTQIYINGEFAEVRFYSGALTGAEATNVINALQASYGLLWPDQAALVLTAARTVEDIGSNITWTVTIPQGVNAAHAVTVAVASSNPGAVTVGGGSSLNLTFAAGATNVQTFTAATVGAGASTLTATSAGLVASSVTLNVLPAPVLIEALRASSLPSQQPGISDGAPVNSWTGDMNPATVASAYGASPVFHTPATPSGAPSVAFDGATTSMYIAGPVSPVAGLTNFSVALVFRADGSATSTSANWYNQTGVLDAEESGTQNDWGITMDSGGNLNFGIGNPDVTLLNPNYNLVNNQLFHIAVLAFDAAHQRMQITVDDHATTTTAPGTTLSTNPRDTTVDNVWLGRGATSLLYWNGELVEADFYNGAVKNPAAVIAALQATYGTAFPSQVLMSLTPSPTAISVGASESLTLTIPAAANASHPVTVFVTNSNPAVVSLAGASGNLLQVVFPAGGTNVQTLTANGLVVGTVSLTYAAAGLVAGAAPSVQVIEAAGQTLVGEWSFNDNAHPYVDSSGFRPAGTHDGVAVGNVALSSDIPTGLTGYSLNLMNTGALQILNTRTAEAGYRSTYDDLLAEAMTITVWVKLNGISDTVPWTPFVSKRGEDNAGYQLRRYSTGPFAVFTIRGTPGADDPSGLAAYEDGTWHHIAGVWDGRTGIRTLYVDGFVDGNASLTGDIGVPAFAPTNSLVLGARDRSNDGSGTAIEGYFPGLLKDVRIYNYALDQVQVRRAMAGLAVYPNVTLKIQHTGANVTLTWSQGKLLEAPALTGPWTTNTTATSPYSVPASAAQHYYRVQVGP